MATKTKGEKRTYISISTDEEVEEDDQSEEDDDESQSEYEGNEEDDSNSSSYSTDDDDDESEIELSEDEETVNEGGREERSDEPPLWDNVIRRLQDNGDLQELSLLECRSYLWSFGLRTSGTKAECTERVVGHWRLKNGNAEALYPRSSFAINCTGDVCRGDIVLFHQRVYKKFNNKTKRTRRSQGRRTTVGRIVRESYGAGTQQHTFTIEVLWSKGVNPLPLLSLKLVKGRNLYKFKTFRQPWKNESERLKILDEKHKRGAAARLVRTMTKAEKSRSENKGLQHQKHSVRTRPSQLRKEAKPKSHNHGKKAIKKREILGKSVSKYANSNNHQPKAHSSKILKKHGKATVSASSRKHKICNHVVSNSQGPVAPSYPYPPHFSHQYLIHPCIQSYPHHPEYVHYSQLQYHHQPYSADPQFPVGRPVMPVSHHQGENYGYYPRTVFENKNVNQ